MERLVARSLGRGTVYTGVGLNGRPLPDVEWELANCAGLGRLWDPSEDSDPFFPKHNESEYTMAKTLCARCVIKTDCGEYATQDLSIQHGVWGGVGPTDRHRERTRRWREDALGRIRQLDPGGDLPSVQEGPGREMSVVEGRIGTDPARPHCAA